MKDYELIQYTLDRDGAYGEGYGYFNFSMLSWSKSLPAMENVFNIDMSARLNGSYKELIWASNVPEKKTFYFGDSSGNLGPMTNFAWLLAKNRDPLLGWFYNYMKRSETFMDVLYETADVPQQDPFGENPVKLFRDVGSTVFKSGWDADDFMFVMRTGPFINHQHLDQGTFWLSGGGSLFIEERHNSTYYDDPIYQPWYTQPVAHSTILVDNNQQSQRVGDLLWHVDGFNDHAFVSHFLDGADASFVRGDIGRLYWGKVKGLQRNVLYLKPDAVLMIDTVEPAKDDVDVTLLYQTAKLGDITADTEASTITEGGNTLSILHLAPEHADVRAVETPHYLFTLRREYPLEPEGMLTVSAKTYQNPLVFVNMLTTRPEGVKPDVTVTEGTGYIYGIYNGADFVVNTRPGTAYTVDNTVLTDALAGVRKENRTFVAMCTQLVSDGRTLLLSDSPITCDMGDDGFKYYLCTPATVSYATGTKPAGVEINGNSSPFSYIESEGLTVLKLPAGEGVVAIR